ncbi:MAG: hypothetical protein ACI8UO_006429 [Verrucomicrobiales bacterium]|jgi:hypothetical protein
MEVIVAISIAMLLVGVAVMSIDSVNQEHSLRREGSLLESAARAAMLRALTSQQSQAIMFRKNAFGVADSANRETWHSLPQDGKLEILRLGEAEWRSPGSTEIWRFIPGRVCEPVSVRITLPFGYQILSFDPLSAAVRESSLVIYSKS